jgi:hypothetical protein
LEEINEQILNPPPAEDDSVPKNKKPLRYSNETKMQIILVLETRQNVSLNDVAKEFNAAAGMSYEYGARMEGRSGQDSCEHKYFRILCDDRNFDYTTKIN